MRVSFPPLTKTLSKKDQEERNKDIRESTPQSINIFNYLLSLHLDVKLDKYCLKWAIASNNIAIVLYLIKQLGFPLEYPTTQFIINVAIERGLVDMVKCLIKLGVPINASDLKIIKEEKRVESLPLMNTAHFIIQTSSLKDQEERGRRRNIYLEIASLLLQAGVDPNIINNKGYSLLMLCCEDINIDIFSLLLKYGADINYISSQDKRSERGQFMEHEGEGEGIYSLINCN